MCMPEIKDKGGSLQTLLKIAMYHLPDTNNGSLLCTDDFFPLSFLASF